MPDELTDREKMRKIPWSISFSATSSVFGALTLFGPVFVLFLNELGLPKTRIGFILSLLPFAGLLALFIASSVARIGVKRVFVTFYLLRKLVTALLILTPWVVARHGIEVTFIFVTVVHGPEMARVSPIADARERVAQAIIASGMRYNIFAPTAFFNDMQELVKSARRLGVAFVFGPGEGVLNPLSAMDLGDEVARVIEDPSLQNSVREVGGKERFTHR